MSKSSFDSSDSTVQCLGCDIITIQKSGGSTTEESKASLLLFLTESDTTVQLRLCTDEATVYRGTIPVSELSNLWSSNARTAAHWISLLFHRRHSPFCSAIDKNPFERVQVAFELQNKDGSQQQPDMTVTVKQEVQGGMMKIVTKTTLQPQCHHDEHAMDIDGNKKESGVLAYCQAMGNALNQSLQRSASLTRDVKVWKQSAQELDARMQSTKDTLFANFTTLRNKLVEKHQRQMRELKEAHEVEKREWKQSASAAAAAATSKKKRELREELANAMDDLGDPENSTSKKLFANDTVSKLAKGERLNDKARRKRVLNPKDATNFVEVTARRKAAKKAKEQQQEDDSGSETEDEF
jgi:hypothetical protein